MSQAQIQTSAQVTTPEKYINTAAVSCNKRLNKTCLHSISHQQETQATYLHSVQYIPNWVGYLGGFKKKKNPQLQPLLFFCESSRKRM